MQKRDSKESSQATTAWIETKATKATLIKFEQEMVVSAHSFFVHVRYLLRIL